MISSFDRVQLFESSWTSPMRIFLSIKNDRFVPFFWFVEDKYFIWSSYVRIDKKEFIHFISEKGSFVRNKCNYNTQFLFHWYTYSFCWEHSIANVTFCRIDSFGSYFIKKWFFQPIFYKNTTPFPEKKKSILSCQNALSA